METSRSCLSQHNERDSWDKVAHALTSETCYAVNKLKGISGWVFISFLRLWGRFFFSKCENLIKLVIFLFYYLVNSLVVVNTILLIILSNLFFLNKNSKILQSVNYDLFTWKRFPNFLFMSLTNASKYSRLLHQTGITHCSIHATETVWSAPRHTDITAQVCFFKTQVAEGDWGRCAPQACSLRLQLRGGAGKGCLDVPSVIGAGVLEERPLTALRGGDMSIQMIAGSCRQLRAQVFFSC